MARHNAANTRIKSEYFQYLKHAQLRDEQSIDQVAKAIARYEEATGHKDFRKFHREQAVAFKTRLDGERNAGSGKPLARPEVHSTLSALRAFSIWLAGQPGYKRRIAYSDADYYNLSEKDVRIAKASREKPAPSLDQVHHALASMPAGTDIEKHNRAVAAPDPFARTTSRPLQRLACPISTRTVSATHLQRWGCVFVARLKSSRRGPKI